MHNLVPHLNKRIFPKICTDKNEKQSEKTFDKLCEIFEVAARIKAILEIPVLWCNKNKGAKKL